MYTAMFHPIIRPSTCLANQFTSTTSLQRLRLIDKKYFHLPKFPNPLGNQSSKKIEVKERKIIGYSADQIYLIVSNVDEYQQFLPWCKKSLVTRRRPGHIYAELVVGFPPVVESYTSSVTLVRPHLVKAECFDGKLFNSMVTEWKFGPGINVGNASSSKTCTLDFRVTFEFRSMFHSALANIFLDEVVHKMTNAFLERAEKRYGIGSIATRNLPVL